MTSSTLLLLSILAIFANFFIEARVPHPHHHPAPFNTPVSLNTSSSTYSSDLIAASPSSSSSAAANPQVTKTVIAWSRALRTCDTKNDLDIPTGTSRIIYATSETDPLSDTKVPFHSTAYGVKNVNLFDAPEYSSAAASSAAESSSSSSSTTAVAAEPTEILPVMSRTFQVDRSSETAPSTYYHCQPFQFNLSTKAHVVRVIPQIDWKNAAYLHHMLLFVCPIAYTEKELQWQGTCYGQDRNRPIKVNACDQINVIAGWAVGGSAYAYPLDVGYPIGDTSNKMLSLMLQIHYHNPLGHTFNDSAGFHLEYTTQLRPREAASLVIHQSLTSIAIPPKTPAYNVSMLLPPACTSHLPREGLTIFASMLHTHTLGVAVQVEHLALENTPSGRQVVELPMIDYNPSYDFNFQQINSFSQSKWPVLRANDAIKVTCTYNSQDRTKVTTGGISTLDEMCHVYLWFIIPLESKGSSPLVDVQGFTSGASSSSPSSSGYVPGQNYTTSCRTDTSMNSYTVAEPLITKPLPSVPCLTNANGNRTYGSSSFVNGFFDTLSLTKDQWLTKVRPSFSRNVTLDDYGRFVLYWKIQEDPETPNNGLIHFAMEVATSGWFGFGISPSGSMLDADSALGYILTPEERLDDQNITTVNLVDRFNREYAMPLPDESQDLFHVMGLQTELDLIVPPPSPIYYNTPGSAPAAASSSAGAMYASTGGMSSSVAPQSASSSRQSLVSSSFVTARRSSTASPSSTSPVTANPLVTSSFVTSRTNPGSASSSSAAMRPVSSSGEAVESSSASYSSSISTPGSYFSSSSSVIAPVTVSDDSASEPNLLLAILLLTTSVVVAVAIIAYVGSRRGWFTPKRHLLQTQTLSTAETSYVAL